MAYYHEDNANVHRGVHTLAERAMLLTKLVKTEKASSALSRAINQRRSSYTWNDNFGLNSDWSFARRRSEPGHEVVTSIMEHHSNIIPWQEAL